MSIEKKSLISTLKTTKKANVASSAPESTKFAAKMPLNKAHKLIVKLPSKAVVKLPSKAVTKKRR